MSRESTLNPAGIAAMLDDFETRYGRASMTLATHAAVADRLTPQLLGLIRQNFLEGALRVQPWHDADVLFGPLSTAQGGDFYEMLPPVRSFLFGVLDRQFPPDRQGRYRSQNVARLIRHHLHAQPPPRRDGSGHLAQFHHQNLWRALAIDEPATAFEKLRDATRERLELSREELGKAPRGGGIVSVAQDILGRFQDEVAYVEAMDLMADGRSEDSVAMLEFLVETGYTAPRSDLAQPADLLQEELVFANLRRNTHSRAKSIAAERGPMDEEAAQQTSEPADAVEVDITRFDLQDSPVSRAVRRGDADALRWALARHPDRIDLLDRFGLAPLHHAVISGREDLTDVLLKAGAAPDVESVYNATPLLLCGGHGLTDLARELLRRDANPVQQTVKGSTPLMFACHYGHRDLVRLLLDRPEVDAAHIMLPNHENITALHWAVGTGDQAIVEMLLDAGAELPVRSRKQWNMLHCAVFGQSLPMTLRMLELGIPVNDVDQRGATPLHFACWDRSSAEITALLLDCGADPFRAMDDGWTPSLLAASWNNADCLILLSRYETFTQAHADHAAGNGASDSLAYLVDNCGLKLIPGQHLDGMLKSDRPRALKYVLEHTEQFGTSREAVFKKIVEFGKPALLRHWGESGLPVPSRPDNVKSWDDAMDRKAEERDAALAALIALDAPLGGLAGSDGFLVTAAREGLAETVDALRARGVAVDVRDASLKTPLAAALDAGHIDLARRFLDDGASPGDTTGGRGNPMIFGKRGEALTFLVRHGADVTARNLAGETMLHVWAECVDAAPPAAPKAPTFDAQNHEAVLRCALDHGLSPDATDAFGNTPLHVAARHGRSVTARLLIAAGATVDMPAQDGFTPYFIALAHGSDALAEVLLEAGARRDHRTPGGWTAMHILAERGQHKGMPPIREALGTWKVAATDPPRTPLQLAAEVNAKDVVELLLRQGVPPDHRAGSTPAPLHLALEAVALEAAIALIDGGADCTTPDPVTGLDARARAWALKSRLRLTEVDLKAIDGVIAMMRGRGVSGVDRE